MHTEYGGTRSRANIMARSKRHQKRQTRCKHSKKQLTTSYSACSDASMLFNDIILGICAGSSQNRTLVWVDR